MGVELVPWFLDMKFEYPLEEKFGVDYGLLLLALGL
jgi:hypothetical protein